MVRKRSLVSGRFFLIWRPASKDERPVMPMSISTMSGRNSRAFSTASPPLAASPMTSKSLSLSSRRRTPWRNSVWSSTSKHLIFGMGESSLIRPLRGICRLCQRAFHNLRGLSRGHANLNARSFSFGRGHACDPAQHCNAFLDACQAKRLVTQAGPGLNTNAIVFNGHLHQIILARHLDHNTFGLGMLGYIVQRLLHHAVDGLFGTWGQTANSFRNRHARFHSRIPGQILG